MKIYIGSALSGVETALANDPQAVGARYLSVKMDAHRRRMEPRMAPDVAAYEKLVEGLSKATVSEVEADMREFMPDGTWPELVIPGGMFDSDLPFTVGAGVACRPSSRCISFIPADIVEKVTVFLLSPSEMMDRRRNVLDACRRMMLKYGKDPVYGHGVSMDVMRYMPGLPQITMECRQLLEAVAAVMRSFPSKLRVVEAEAAVEHPNRNLRKAAEHVSPVKQDMVEPEALYARTVDLLYGKEVQPEARNIVPAMWTCLRTRTVVGASICQKCIESLGGSVLEQAAGDWKERPCAYEVAYGPGPHKTMEESVKNHSWNPLP